MTNIITRRSFLRLAPPSADTIRLTPIDSFFQQQWRKPPVQRDPQHWGLLLDGLVDAPLALSYDDLQQFPQRTITSTIACTGDLIGTAQWQGVPAAALLADVQPQSAASYVGFYAADGYCTSVALPQMTHALLAYGMNDNPLPHSHGGPVRLIVPGLQGYKMPKWVQRIELRSTPLNGPWEQRGWSQSGDAPTQARFTTPRHKARVTRQIQLTGFAFAGARQITAIEISANNSPWMPVSFRPAAPNISTHWRIDWTAPHTGEHRLTVRACDDEQINGQPHTITLYAE